MCNSWLIRDLVMTCSWRVHSLFTICSWLVHNLSWLVCYAFIIFLLLFITSSWLLHDTFNTCPLLVHSLYRSCSRFFHDLIMAFRQLSKLTLLMTSSRINLNYFISPTSLTLFDSNSFNLTISLKLFHFNSFP